MKASKEFTWKKQEKDLLDIQCDRVFQAIENIRNNQEKIAVLEQCIDYLRMEIAEQENARLREELAKSRLVWSDEAPTEEGWYWYRTAAGSYRWHAIKHVVCDERLGLVMDDWRVSTYTGQWAGPIPEPQEPTQEPSE